mmetsp:Transcript_70228/g.139073  ORF Transcript_70228/g.139073 Transcript_70228/m.139073 type:complete len:267 (+) Transcript_70228:1146-1946(+)
MSLVTRDRSLETVIPTGLIDGIDSTPARLAGGVGLANEYVMGSSPASSASMSVVSCNGSLLGILSTTLRYGMSKACLEAASRISLLSTFGSTTSLAPPAPSGNHTEASKRPSFICTIEFAGNQLLPMVLGLTSKKFFFVKFFTSARKGQLCSKSSFIFALSPEPKGKIFVPLQKTPTSGSMSGCFSTLSFTSRGGVPMAATFHRISFRCLPMPTKLLSSLDVNSSTIMSSSGRGASMVFARRLIAPGVTRGYPLPHRSPRRVFVIC